MLSLKLAPPITLLSVMADKMKATSTPRMVKLCERRRPIQLPPNWVPQIPASKEPTSGARGMASSVLALRV